ncbi:Panacea domain-containing protein [Helicobacter marmotae]|uniref:DUF4065 domain-containing protein n=1 Tax=Helicobacter marmotae TaxID=152490 RepID=A0A3D8I6E1_9HELI|nr:type II toxin-antitoxin system antitoxin SocA domain-containing protein [Helicobacter marmotae]RDU60740.1 DUF4065 domain-containing protein [Helicobacter marmotae]
MLKAFDVALYFLFMAKSENMGDTISNLKMQKLLYLAQGHYIAVFDEPLFNDKIEAWRYGPVVKSVYDKFKKYKDLSIDFKELDKFNASLYTQKHLDMLPYVFYKYNISARELVALTHDSGPWKEYYNQYTTQEIPLQAVKAYFKETLEEDAKRYL